MLIAREPQSTVRIEQGAFGGILCLLYSGSNHHWLDFLSGIRGAMVKRAQGTESIRVDSMSPPQRVESALG